MCIYAPSCPVSRPIICEITGKVSPRQGIPASLTSFLLPVRSSFAAQYVRLPDIVHHPSHSPYHLILCRQYQKKFSAFEIVPTSIDIDVTASSPAEMGRYSASSHFRHACLGSASRSSTDSCLYSMGPGYGIRTQHSPSGIQRIIQPMSQR